MTCFSIKKVFEKKFSYQNLENATSVMGCIFGVHISGKEKRIIKDSSRLRESLTKYNLTKITLTKLCYNIKCLIIHK